MTQLELLQQAEQHRRELQNNPNYKYWVAPYYHNLHWMPVINTLEEFRAFPLNPVYKVSNFGRVYNTEHHWLLNMQYDKDGYLRVNIPINNIETHIQVHRMIMITFEPRPDYKDMQVNHMNGIKTWNVYLPGYPEHNLEWCTNKENNEHAIRTGLINVVGENNGSAKRTDEEVRVICELLHNNPAISAREVAQKMNIPYDNAFKEFISFIRNGKHWSHISQDYNITPHHTQREHISDELVHQICHLLSQNIYNYAEIAKLIGYENDKAMQDIIGRIKRGCSHRKISQFYEFMKEENV